MSASPSRRPVGFAVGRGAAVVVGFAAFLGGIIAYDAARERWPQQADLAELWVRELLGIGLPTERYGGALVTDGGESLMRFMHRRGFDPETTLGGVTALTAALDMPPGSAVAPERLAVLLDAGADPDRRAPDGHLPLAIAATNGTVRHVRLLLDHGAAPNGIDATGRGVLDGLSLRRSDAAEIVTLLLDRGLDPCTLLAPSPSVGPTARPLPAALAEQGYDALATRARVACAAKSALETEPAAKSALENEPAPKPAP